MVPPLGAAGLAGLAAREPGKPVSPSPGGPAGLTGPARLGRVGSRAPTRDLTSGRVPKSSAPRSLRLWKLFASPFLPSFASYHLPAVLWSLPGDQLYLG